MSPRPSRRPLIAAATVSLVVHLGLLVQMPAWAPAEAPDIGFPLETRLVEPQPKVPPAAAQRAPAQPAKTLAAPTSPSRIVAVTPTMPVPEAEAPPPPDSHTEPPVTPSPPEDAPVPAEPPPPEPPKPATESPLPAEAAVPSPASTLPAELELRYRILAGDKGFAIGQARYRWHMSADGRYDLTSVAEATGLASLFVSGRIVQTSEGRIGTRGLQPDRFSLQRNDRRQDTARFDWEAGRVQLGDQWMDLPAGQAVQDLLGFPFHLALTAAGLKDRFVLWVTNGRKLKDYDFRDLGPTELEVEQQRIPTLHLQGTRPGEGTLDVWLDRGNPGLPIMIRTLDNKGNLLVLVAEGRQATP